MKPIRHFAPNWFTVTMGTGIFSLLLGQLPGPFWLHAAGVELWRVNIALFGLFTLLYATRWALYPREAARIFSHPVMPMFLGAIPMGLATIVNGSIAYAHDYDTALYLWCADAGLSVLVGLGVPLAMFTRQTHWLESMTAVWLLPIVASEVAAASAGLLAPHLAGPAALNVLLAGYVLWSLSVPLALSVLVILFSVWCCTSCRIRIWRSPAGSRWGRSALGRWRCCCWAAPHPVFWHRWGWPMPDRWRMGWG